MRYTFYGTETFNQNLGGWAVHSVKDMDYMFKYASAFDQDLGWCVGVGVDLDDAFDDTQCEATYCGVMWETNTGDCEVSRTGNVMVNWKIRWAVAGWLSDATAAETTYGHISTWQTGEVTDMSELFENAPSFNEEISSWDTSGVKDMSFMFNSAAAFNQDIGAWDTSGVTSLSYMFYFASAFDQDLGWCVGAGVDLDWAFDDTQCESTYCGVMWETNTGDCEVSRTGNVMVNWKIRWAVAGWLSDATAAEETYGHISTWDTGGVTDMSSLLASWNGGAAFNEDISSWDTSSVTTMQDTFYGAETFNQNL